MASVFGALTRWIFDGNGDDYSALTPTGVYNGPEPWGGAEWESVYNAKREPQQFLAEPRGDADGHAPGSGAAHAGPLHGAYGHSHAVGAVLGGAPARTPGHPNVRGDPTQLPDPGHSDAYGDHVHAYCDTGGEHDGFVSRAAKPPHGSRLAPLVGDGGETHGRAPPPAFLSAYSKPPADAPYETGFLAPCGVKDSRPADPPLPTLGIEPPNPGTFKKRNLHLMRLESGGVDFNAPNPRKREIHFAIPPPEFALGGNDALYAAQGRTETLARVARDLDRQRNGAYAVEPIRDNGQADGYVGYQPFLRIVPQLAPVYRGLDETRDATTRADVDPQVAPDRRLWGASDQLERMDREAIPFGSRLPMADQMADGMEGQAVYAKPDVTTTAHTFSPHVGPVGAADNDTFAALKLLTPGIAERTGGTDTTTTARVSHAHPEEALGQQVHPSFHEKGATVNTATPATVRSMGVPEMLDGHAASGTQYSQRASAKRHVASWWRPAVSRVMEGTEDSVKSGEARFFYHATGNEGVHHNRWDLDLPNHRQFQGGDARMKPTCRRVPRWLGGVDHKLTVEPPVWRPPMMNA